MQSGILAINPSDLVLPAAIAAGVLALAVFIYGFVRRFPRVSWLSWQILIVFAATFFLSALPVPEGGRVGWNGFLLAAGLLAGTGAVVLAVGGVVRHAMLMRARPANGFFRFMSRLLGGITALGNFAVFFLVLGAPVLAALPVFHVDVAALDVVYNSPVWELFGGHAFDLFVVAVFLIMMRAGYRIGFVRTVWTVFTFALGVGALILSFVLAVRVPDFAGSCKMEAVEKDGELQLRFASPAIDSDWVRIRPAAPGFTLSGEFVPAGDCELNALHILPRGTALGFYQLINFRNRHHTSAVWPELLPGMECESSTDSSDRQFAPHPAAMLLTAGSDNLFCGVSEPVAGSFGMMPSAR